jgi:hypothetical protein
MTDIIEDEIEVDGDLVVEEEEAGESVLREEKERVISRMNRGIVYQNISLESIL